MLVPLRMSNSNLCQTADAPYPLEPSRSPTALRLLKLPIPYERGASSSVICAIILDDIDPSYRSRYSMVSRLRPWEPFIDALIARKASHFPALQQLSMGEDFTWPVNAYVRSPSLILLDVDALPRAPLAPTSTTQRE